jgi:spore coat polysaccharide biosynthesis protein SpsF
VKVVAIIQARMGSTRLPGKVLKEVLDKPLLEYLLERVKRSKLIDEIVVATTLKKSDDPIVDLCKKMLLPFYRGSEDNVLSRFYEAAQKFNANVIVRLTSDCPITDPKVVDKVIQYYLEHYDQYQYVSNTLKRTYPRGLDTEVFSLEALIESYQNGKTKSEQEHVTSYILNHPNKFKTANIMYKEDQSQHRWTVDTPEDFELVKLIIENLYSQTPQFSLEDSLDLFTRYPEWMLINSHIEQKKI